MHKSSSCEKQQLFLPVTFIWRIYWKNKPGFAGNFVNLFQSNFALLRTNLKTGVSRKQSTPNFPKNKHFLPPDTHTYVCISRGKKCLFFGKFDMLCFLETPLLRIALLLYYRRYYLQTSRNLVFFMFENS